MENGRKKDLPSRVTIERAAKGGHIVESYYENNGAGESYRPHEKHVFTSHKDMMTHLHAMTGGKSTDSTDEDETPAGVGKPTRWPVPGPTTRGAGID